MPKPDAGNNSRGSLNPRSSCDTLRSVKALVCGALVLLFVSSTFAQMPAPAPKPILLRPKAVFDGKDLHPGWAVLVRAIKLRPPAPSRRSKRRTTPRTIDLPNDTLLPGLIEGHSHLFLHPYNETSWNDQVTNESLAYRTAAATAHARATLLAGFTTMRDLGTEGAGYGDVGLKKAIDQGIVPGPRMIVVTRAIVATGSYGPKLVDRCRCAAGRAGSERRGRDR